MSISLELWIASEVSEMMSIGLYSSNSLGSICNHFVLGFFYGINLMQSKKLLVIHIVLYYFQHSKQLNKINIPPEIYWFFFWRYFSDTQLFSTLLLLFYWLPKAVLIRNWFVMMSTHLILWYFSVQFTFTYQFISKNITVCIINANWWNWIFTRNDIFCSLMISNELTFHGQNVLQ